jgi:hypothetical protein
VRILKSAPWRAAVAALFFLLTDCGGGGGSPVSGPIMPAPDKLRADLLFGYYGGCPTCPLEQADHVNLYWAGNLYGLLNTMAELNQARAAGISNIVLAVPAYAANAELEVRFHLKRLQEAGLLANIRALYPIDEPDLHDKTADEIRATNAMLRRVAADFPELAEVKLAVIYAPTRVKGTWPGVETYDWVGFDDYDNRERIFLGAGGEYGMLKHVLRPDQRILLVPGGVDPWRQDPAAFLAKAETDPQVIAIIPFIWQDLSDPGAGLGIRSNGLRQLYCEAGKTVKDPSTRPAC